MNKKAKIWLIVLGLIVVSGIALYSGSAELFQGRMSKSSNPLPAYDENKCYDSDGGKNYEEAGTIYGKLSRSEFGSKTDVCTTRTKLKEYYCDGKFIRSQEYNCENGCGNGACKEQKISNQKLDNVVDTLVIVNSDNYDIDFNEIQEFFDAATTLWLEPKTGIKFHILDLKIVSFSQLGLNSEDPYFDYLTNKYFIDTTAKTILPEFIVFFDKDESSVKSGGHTYYYGYDWLVGENYCTEFPVLETRDDVEFLVPGAVIDFKHKFGRCGYDKEGKDIISELSGNGECKNENGLECIVKNGYQMCPNLVDSFYAQNVNYFTSNIVVHELLHFYADDPIELEHYTTLCLEKLGYDLSESSMEEYSEVFTQEPFDSLGQEYADICDYIWQQFKNSQQICN